MLSFIYWNISLYTRKLCLRIRIAKQWIGFPLKEEYNVPFVLRYSNNDTGAITFTGNTLGLSRSNQTGVPGTGILLAHL